MGEFRLPSGLWGTDVFPDWAIKNAFDSFIVRPIGTNPQTKHLEPLLAIHHTGNTTFMYSNNINGELRVNGSSGYGSYIDQNVGIQTHNPEYEVDVIGNVNCTFLHGNGALITNLGGVLPSKWIETDNKIYYNEGTVSINTSIELTDGLLNINGNVKANYNKDTTSYFGRSAIGSTLTSTDIAYFSHLDHNTDTNYALSQDSLGKTIINTPSIISLSIGNEDKLSINDTLINIDTDVIINGTLIITGGEVNLYGNNVSIHDPLITLNTNMTGSPIYDAGFISKRGDDINVGFIWDESEKQFALINTTIADIYGNVPITNYIGLKVGEIQVNGTNDSYIMGLVGVNMTEPQYELDINGTISGNRFYINNVEIFANVGSLEIGIITDEKSTGSAGGTLVNNVWNIRTLNTIVLSSSISNNISLSSNQIILEPGDYNIIIKAPAYLVDEHRTRLYNITDSTVVAYGNSTTGKYASSYIETYVSITSTKTYEVHHYVSTLRSLDGGGVASGFTGNVEIYTTVNIKRLN
jgi:hypothetical protein